MESVSMNAGMVRGSLGLQENMAMKLIESGVQQAQAAIASSGGSDLRTATLHTQGVGQNLDVTA
ncbi:MAG: hypothetical protein RRY20_07335 [Bilophila sp.]